MAQEEKELLLKDLCSRVLYRPKGVFLHKLYDPEEVEVIGYNGKWVEVHRKGDFDEIPIELVRLYLRPMYSITQEELKELNDKYGNIAYFFMQDPPYYHGLQAQHSDIGSIEISEFSEIYDWLDAHYFDYRIVPSTGNRLIESGLALEAPKGMYKTE